MFRQIPVCMQIDVTVLKLIAATIEATVILEIISVNETTVEAVVIFIEVTIEVGAQ